MREHEFTLEYLEEIVLPEMRSLQEAHPKANIIFNADTNRIDITYPLPADFRKLQKIEYLGPSIDAPEVLT